MVYIHRTAEDWVARGIPRKHIVNRETHPVYVDSNWPLNQNQQDLLGERGFYHFPHLQPQSVLITPIGKMWVEGGHWRCEHLFRYMVRSEEHTSELSHSQISYAVFCLQKLK